MQPQQKKQYKELDPFEVVQAEDSKVAINNGSISIGSSSISFKNCQFKSTAKPQNLMKEHDAARFLTVKKGQVVCLIIKEISSSLPDVEIKAISEEDLTKEENKRKVNKIYKLARIRDIDDKSKIMDIENLFMSEIVAEVENWPPFTPIIWPVEKEATPKNEGSPEDCEVKYDTWKAIFTPGSLYVPTSMNEPVEFKIEDKPMSSFPIQEIKEGDEWWVTYEIDKNWAIKGSPKFEKSPTATTVEATIPVKPESDCASSCVETDGSYALKVLKFEKKLGGLVATMYWRSDVTVSGWKRCGDGCAENSNGSITSATSSTGSDKSTAIVPVNWSPTGYTALFVEEAPEVWFRDCMKVKITGRVTVVQMDPKYVSVCERGQIWVSGICGDKPARIGAKIIDNKIIITTGYIFKPESVNITLTGVRKGFLGHRFPNRTKKQFIENEAFINSAYSP